MHIHLTSKDNRRANASFPLLIVTNPAGVSQGQPYDLQGLDPGPQELEEMRYTTPRERPLCVFSHDSDCRFQCV